MLESLKHNKWNLRWVIYFKDCYVTFLHCSHTDVAEVVLSKCIKTTKKQNGTYVKKYYYEFLDDYHSKSRSKQKKDETAE